MVLDENYVIQKSMPLLQELRHRNLTVFELKLIEIYLSRINSHNPDSRTVIFEKNELKKIFGTSFRTDILRQSLEHIQHLQVSEIAEDGTLITERTTNLFDYSEPLKRDTFFFGRNDIVTTIITKHLHGLNMVNLMYQCA